MLCALGIEKVECPRTVFIKCFAVCAAFAALKKGVPTPNFPGSLDFEGVGVHFLGHVKTGKTGKPVSYLVR